jgi:hypothetical protein
MPRSRLARRFLVATVVTMLLVAPAVIDAIYVSPTAVFIDHRTKAGQVTIGNSGEAPEEVTIDLRFGFPDTDSAGTVFIRFIDDPGPNFPSAADWIRPFPPRVRLEPGSQQVVRLLARPPEDLPDGEYWSRMIVTARGAPVAITTDTALRAGVTLEVRLVTAVTYRKGQLSTGISLRNLSAEVDGDSLAVWASLSREGNAAYLGTATFELVTLQGAVVRTWPSVLAVYYPMTRRFYFTLEGVDPGDYVLRVTLKAERPDLTEGQVLPAPPVSDSVPVRVG